MSIPPSNVVGGNVVGGNVVGGNVVGGNVVGGNAGDRHERAGEPPLSAGAAGREPSRPPPLPQAPTPVAGSGFTSVVRHLSLRGWLRWIHTNGSDAALRVRTREGGSGNIWCRAGRIIDAEWGQRAADEALQEMLGLASGAVTIDFDPVERPRRITRPTRELLHLVQRGPGRGSELTQPAQTSSPPAAAAGPPLLEPAADLARDQPFRNSLLPGGDAAHSSSPSRPKAARISRREYFSGGSLLAGLALTAFAFGRIRATSVSEPASAPEPEPAQQIKSGLLPTASPPSAQPEALLPTQRGLPVIPFVAIEVEPADAEVWLDQALVGLGRIDLARMPDGALHELRFVAAGYVTRSLFFLDAPPAGRVVLERASEPSSRAVAGANADLPHEAAAGELPGSDGGGEPEVAKKPPRRRARAAPAQVRERPAADLAPATAKSTRVEPAPQVPSTEARRPRVQVLE